jgi:hypothetical protein
MIVIIAAVVLTAIVLVIAFWSKIVKFFADEESDIDNDWLYLKEEPAKLEMDVKQEEVKLETSASLDIKKVEGDVVSIIPKVKVTVTGSL